jgi:hypothetical protein
MRGSMAIQSANVQSFSKYIDATNLRSLHPKRNNTEQHGKQRDVRMKMEFPLSSIPEQAAAKELECADFEPKKWQTNGKPLFTLGG